LLRGAGAPFSLQPDGTVSNQIRIRISNRTNSERSYRISVNGAENGTVVIPQSPFAVEPAHTGTTTLFVLLPRSEFQRGERAVTVNIDDGAGMVRAIPYRLLGPGQAR
jgi:hypothetical protein